MLQIWIISILGLGAVYAALQWVLVALQPEKEEEEDTQKVSRPARTLPDEDSAGDPAQAQASPLKREPDGRIEPWLSPLPAPAPASRKKVRRKKAETSVDSSALAEPVKKEGGSASPEKRRPRRKEEDVDGDQACDLPPSTYEACGSIVDQSLGASV